MVHLERLALLRRSGLESSALRFVLGVGVMCKNLCALVADDVLHHGRRGIGVFHHAGSRVAAGVKLKLAGTATGSATLALFVVRLERFFVERPAASSSPNCRESVEPLTLKSVPPLFSRLERGRLQVRYDGA